MIHFADQAIGEIRRAHPILFDSTTGRLRIGNGELRRRNDTSRAMINRGTIKLERGPQGPREFGEDDGMNGHRRMVAHELLCGGGLCSVVVHFEESQKDVGIDPNHRDAGSGPAVLFIHGLADCRVDVRRVTGRPIDGNFNLLSRSKMLRRRIGTIVISPESDT